MTPLITCVCPTTGRRREWIPRMLDCFFAQTYESRHLLIVAEKGEGVEDLVPCDARVALVYAPRLTLGAKRNYACSAALGEYIAHFDDDDWSAPDRLSDQMRTIASTGKAVAGYRHMKFTDGSLWWQYSNNPTFALGTSLCYRKDWWAQHPFPAIPKGSDCQFVYEAQAQKQLVVEDPRDLMVASVHGGKTNRLSCAPPNFLPLSPAEVVAGVNW